MARDHSNDQIHENMKKNNHNSFDRNFQFLQRVMASSQTRQNEKIEVGRSNNGLRSRCSGHRSGHRSDRHSYSCFVENRKEDLEQNQEEGEEQNRVEAEVVEEQM